MTTTELIKILQDNEKGAISHKSREISLVINGRYMINPQIKVSGTGDGICGAEIDLDINGEWLEQEPCDDCVSRQEVEELLRCGCAYDIWNLPSALPKREQGEWIEHPHECGENWEFSKYECSICHMWEENDSDFCPNCGAEMKTESEE